MEHAMSENLTNDSDSETNPPSPHPGQPPLIELDELEIPAKLAAIVHSNPWMSPDSIARDTQRIMQMNATVGAKRQRLIELADRVNAAVQPHMACRTGCSYCCSMPTMIFQHEAERLADASGRPAVPLRFRSHDHALLAALRFYGQACPFLNEGRCTVYAARPIICRLHHSLNASPANCDCSIPPAELKGVGEYSSDYVEMPYHLLSIRANPDEPWGAIQEFFP
jgi:Fe-S-cluster containining protein